MELNESQMNTAYHKELKAFPPSEGYFFIDVIGRDAIDFGHRLFSRNLKKPPVGWMDITLSLTPKGKVKHLFWCLIQNNALKLIIREQEAKSLFESLQFYHFAEALEITEPCPISSYWNLTKATEKNGSIPSGLWNGIQFIFGETFENLKNPIENSEWELQRILHLIPRLGSDYSEDTLVFELGLEEFCDENKGCYIGQEVVERVRSRGGEASKRLCLLKSEARPSPNEIILSNEIEAGAVTSSIAFSSQDSCFYSLGFLRKGFLNQEKILQTKDTASKLTLLKEA